MFTLNGKRISGAFKAQTKIGKDSDGNDIFDEVSYPPNWLELAKKKELTALGIEVIDEPARESEETHYVEVLEEAPYIRNTPKPQSVIDEQDNSKVKNRIKDVEGLSLRAMRECVIELRVALLETNPGLPADIGADLVAIDEIIIAERAKLKAANAQSKAKKG
jgi:hypothetical protein